MEGMEKKENTVAQRTVTVTKSKRNIEIQVLLYSNTTEEEFLFTNLFFHCFSCFLKYLWSIMSVIRFIEA